MGSISPKILVTHLAANSNGWPTLLQRFKCIYRPYICPYDDLLDLLPEQQRILDIGCGSGILLQLIAKYRRPKSLAGIDIDGSVIHTAKSTLNASAPSIPARLEIYDGYTLPAWAAEYDYVFLVDVLHHIPRTQQIPFLEMLFDHLGPGSTLIIKDIDGSERFWSLFNKLHDVLVSHLFAWHLPSKAVESSLRRIGFKTSGILKRRMIVYPHFTIVCRKKVNP